MRRGRARVYGAILVAALSGAFPCADLFAQSDRNPIVPHVDEARPGELLLGLGVELRSDARFPLSGLRGDLFVPAKLTFTYVPAPRVLLEVRGDLWRILEVEDRGPSAVPLDPEVADGTTTDFGDFELSAAYAPVKAGRLTLGGLFRVALPNSDESRGIGTNTTNVLLALLGGVGVGRVHVAAEAGVAILEAPVETFEQNDALAYAAEIRFGDPADAVRVGMGVEGRASTRGRVPLGTEDRGEVRLAGEWLPAGRAWQIDGGVGFGYAGSSPAWTTFMGVGVRL